MTRYFRLFAMQFRTSTLLAAQYRNDFFLDAFTGLFWTAAAVMPLFVVYGESNRQGIPGWSFGETLVVVACFISLQAVLDGMISPGLQQVIEHIRKGTLDFVLLKPADAQFLVSTSRFQFWKGAGLIHAGLVFYLAFRQLGHGPTALGVALCILLLFVGSLLLYSLWVLIISAAFYFVKVDNLSYLLHLDLRCRTLAEVGVQGLPRGGLHLHHSDHRDDEFSRRGAVGSARVAAAWPRVDRHRGLHLHRATGVVEERVPVHIGGRLTFCTGFPTGSPPCGIGFAS